MDVTRFVAPGPDVRGGADEDDRRADLLDRLGEVGQALRADRGRRQCRRQAEAEREGAGTESPAQRQEGPPGRRRGDAAVGRRSR